MFILRKATESGAAPGGRTRGVHLRPGRKRCRSCCHAIFFIPKPPLISLIASLFASLFLKVQFIFFSANQAADVCSVLENKDCGHNASKRKEFSVHKQAQYRA